METNLLDDKRSYEFTMKTQNLPFWEFFLYCIVWIIGLLYSTYQVYLTGNKFVSLYINDLAEGWSFIPRKKDDTDEEWRTWISFILITLSPWILIHHIGARIVYKFYAKIMPLWYTFITSACVLANFGLQSFLVLLSQPLMFCIFLQFSRSRVSLWLACYILCFIFTHENCVPLYSVSYEDLKFVIPTLMWTYLRCISYSMCVIENSNLMKDVFSFFGYVFYLPCFFLGPVLLFDEFHAQQYGRKMKNSLSSIVALFLQNIRYLFWIFITELYLHYIYVNSLLDYIGSFAQIKCENVWLMYGMGFFMGQFFFLKYTVVYGLALTWTRAEGYKTPNPPECIAYVYLYSDMWRNFDQPLYKFIKRHIYEPMLESIPPRTQMKKAFVSFVCFVFIYIWHGLDYSIFMWSFLNYCGITVEMIVRYFCSAKWYSKLLKLIGLRNERRFLGLICAPLIIVSAISNFYFLGGAAVAETYFNFIFIRGTKSTLLCLWILLYVSCQVSIQVKTMKREIIMKCDSSR